MDIEQRLITAVDRMPAFPQSVQRVLELTRDVNVEPKAIVEVLEKDPVMAARILKTINSAYYGLPRKVSSVGHAVVMLGINTVKHMALAIASAGMLPVRNNAGFDTAEYLQHSLAVAGLARLLAQRIGGTDPGEAYIAGLLHDFGKVLFAVNLPQEFHVALEMAATEGVSLHLAEQRVLGVDHTRAGAMLAEKWQFPASLSECIGAHHGLNLDNGALRCLFLADQLAKFDAAGEPLPGRRLPALPAGIGGALGDSYPSIIEALPERNRILDEALAFSH